MEINRARNVCQALPQTLEYLSNYGNLENSRNGPVLVSPQPMIIVTDKPTERVLFSHGRDANPFFHLAEAMWMLAGRNDAKFLNRFIKDFGNRFAESDGTIHDAYGYRWRHTFSYDQLEVVLHKLQQDPTDRQCVIQMWDADTMSDDLVGSWRTRPCNTHIFLRLRENELDLTVCCRSNDMIWGAHGANAVHFSVLQEYLAARLGVQVGCMYQLSNNAHVYMDVFKKILVKMNQELKNPMLEDLYAVGKVTSFPMFDRPDKVYSDLDKFFDEGTDYDNSWFKTTLRPMMQAHTLYKASKHDLALNKTDEIFASDWRTASYEWIYRRAK